MKKILLLFFLISTFAYCDQWFDSIEINNIELTKLLLKNGADINAKDENGDKRFSLKVKNFREGRIDALLHKQIRSFVVST